MNDSDFQMARQSLVEELQAINWYEERIRKVKDKKLKRILEHNMNEEKEHVAMLMEWLKERDKVQGKVFKEHD